ncbi:hypothetical protein HMPREF3213_01919 [Heyndrickxia coagulans]|uniref:Uncharacterized protein n=1 Tax=Heyndrickxia coagulans TaxID=1398 RepID=A0A133KQ34_HEYCO|nr:hypothetical protein HMPREF3213_01919 [Heyndrickxia coagulans]
MGRLDMKNGTGSPACAVFHVYGQAATCATEPPLTRRACAIF